MKKKQTLIMSMLPAIYSYCHAKDLAIEDFLTSLAHVKDIQPLLSMYFSIFQSELEPSNNDSAFEDSFIKFNLNNINYSNVKNQKDNISYSSVAWSCYDCEIKSYDNIARIQWTVTDESVSFFCHKKGFFKELPSFKNIGNPLEALALFQEHSDSDRPKTEVQVCIKDSSRDNFTENSFNVLGNQLHNFMENDTNALLCIVSKQVDWGDLPKNHHWYEAGLSTLDKSFEIHFSSALEYLMSINATKEVPEIQWCLDNSCIDSFVKVGEGVISKHSYPDAEKHNLVLKQN